MDLPKRPTCPTCNKDCYIGYSNSAWYCVGHGCIRPMTDEEDSQFRLGGRTAWYELSSISGLPDDLKTLAQLILLEMSK